LPIAKKLGIVHLGCCSHALNLAAQELEINDKTIASVCADCQECHSHSTIKASNKRSAALTNVQESFYKLKLMATSCWLSAHELIANHVKARMLIFEK
jgi:hypothetical protein